MDTSPFPLHHVAIAVHSIEEAMPLYERLIGLPGSPIEHVAAQQVRVAFVGTGAGMLELIEPTSDDSGVARFLARRGPGLHHIAYRVPDIRAALAAFIADGMNPIDAEPRAGAAGHQVAFLHPRDLGGVLVELVQTGA